MEPVVSLGGTTHRRDGISASRDWAQSAAGAKSESGDSWYVWLLFVSVVVQKMVGSSSKPALGGVTEEITAYFSDIQGFSAFSEQLPAERLVELLNEYLTACTDVIQNEFGTLDKYIGDAVVAMFGAPVELPDHAYRACVTAP